jgi:CDP-glucose 4,6-dehydratase
VLESDRDPLGTFKTNVIGTANLLESVSFLKDKTTVISITTDKVYDNKGIIYKYKESDKLKGKDPYSASKVGAESVISAWKNIWNINQSHNICSVRAGNVIGGGDLSKDRLIPDIIRSTTSNSKVIIRNPKSSRPWQHVLDPLVGYVYAANSLLAGKIFESINFGPSEDSLCVEEVLSMAKIEFSNNLQYKITQNNDNKIDLESKYLDLDFATKNLNWSPRWDQKEALTRTFTWWDSVISGRVSARDACKIDIDDFLNQGDRI